MQILLCAATSMEIQPTIAYLQKTTDHQIEVLITGVGLTATTYHITKKVIAGTYDLLVQAGIAGSLQPSLAVLQSVVVGSEALGDFGVQEKEGFQSLFDLGFIGENETPWTQSELVNSNEHLLSAANLPQVKGITVQEITTRTERVAHYVANGGEIETMEGAAFHYVALLENIPFVQLRTISNQAGERDKKKWMIDDAIRELNKELQTLLQKLIHLCK